MINDKWTYRSCKDMLRELKKAGETGEAYKALLHAVRDYETRYNVLSGIRYEC